MRKESKQRSLQSKLVLGVKVLALVELGAVIGAYLFWKKMNTSQDFRYKVHQNFPYCLEGYYFMGEKLGGLQTREFDYKQWGIHKNSPDENC